MAIWAAARPGLGLHAGPPTTPRPNSKSPKPKIGAVAASRKSRGPGSGVGKTASLFKKEQKENSGVRRYRCGLGQHFAERDFIEPCDVQPVGEWLKIALQLGGPISFEPERPEISTNFRAPGSNCAASAKSRPACCFPGLAARHRPRKISGAPTASAPAQIDDRYARRDRVAMAHQQAQRARAVGHQQMRWILGKLFAQEADQPLFVRLAGKPSEIKIVKVDFMVDR